MMFSDEAVNNLMRIYEIQIATELFSTLSPKKVITSPSFVPTYYPVH
jgi:hypothetical protein